MTFSLKVFIFLVYHLMITPTICKAQDADSLVFSVVRDTFWFSFGAKQVLLERSEYNGGSSIFYIHIHGNEKTSLRAAEYVLQKSSGVLLRILNGSNRNISFSIGNEKWEFDPNRIFTGPIRKWVSSGVKHKSRAVKLVREFASFVLMQIPEEAKTVIALHNNDNESNKLDITTYVNPSRHRKDALWVHANNSLDKDDFFFTTDTVVFDKLSGSKYNVVLQDKVKASDDGSLSVYYGRIGKSYVNLEAQHQHLKQQIEMLERLVILLKE